MSTETQRPEITTSSAIQSLNVAYEQMDMSLSRYLLIAVFPTVIIFIGSIVFTVFFGLPLSIGIPLMLVGAFSLVVSVVYPKVEQDRKRQEIRQRFHLFLTHITVLSMTNVNRVEIFRILAEEDEYKALAEEMGHLVGLIDTWNQSLDDACRIRSRLTTSPLLQDFLERLAYTVGAGQQISEFLIDEQDSIIQQFTNRYEAELTKLDVVKELYMSLMLSMYFVLVFAIVLPIIIGMSPTLLIAGTVAMFTFVQIGFAYAIHVVSPFDPLWYIKDTAGDGPLARIPRALVIGFGGSVITGVIVGAILLGFTPIATDRIPLPVAAALIATPLIIPGWRMRQEDKNVRERDTEFPAFIRALGAVESVKQSSTSNVLAVLREKDFGSLTSNVNSLYKRLNIRIDDVRAWRLFAAETGSYLIQKFGDMYVIGRQMGGDPRILGQLISTNQMEVIKVREKRQQAATTFIGVMYGVTTVGVFSFFVGLEVVEIMIEISEDLDIDRELVGGLLTTAHYNIAVIEYLLIMAIILNAMMSAIMIRLTDRGHMVSALVHFVGLIWLSAIIAVLTQMVIGPLLSV